MAKLIGSLSSWVGGIADTIKTGQPYSFAFGRSIDFRSDPSQLTILPKTTKISGSTVTDLPMNADAACDQLFFYGNTGKVYMYTSGTLTAEYQIPDSVGNGMAYFPEDRNLYLAANKTISRRSNACGEGSYFDSFLESEGGTPTNTHSLDLEASSSQSAARADTASLSITSDLTLEAYLKPESLPTGTDQMTVVSKWEEDGTTRSYKLGIIPTSAAFGDGSDGALTISTNTTEAPIDANCTGTSGTNTLTVSNVTGTFLTGQKILIHQSRGTGAGQYQFNEIIGVNGSVLTLADNLSFSPAHSATTTVANKAQVRVINQYTDVTINAGVTWTAKSWNGLKGGILAFLANGTVTVNGAISAAGAIGTNTSTSETTGGGYYGGRAQNSSPSQAYAGEGTAGPAINQTTANSNGGGGGFTSSGSQGSSGGGGGNGSIGANGNYEGGAINGKGGTTAGSANLTTMVFGGGGGGGANDGTTFGTEAYASGGSGGGIVLVQGNIVILGSSAGTRINVTGGNGGSLGSASYGGGGGGAGGSVLIRATTATLETTKIIAAGGSGGSGGGAGGSGRIHIDYYTSVTGTTSPTLNSAQDDTLGVSEGHALRLYISNDGTNTETYTQNIDNPQDFWNRFSVAWDASASTAYFYQNAILLGTKTGAMTAINDNASEFAIGAYTNSGSARTGFYDGLIDDVRVWNTLRTASEISIYNTRVLTGDESGLVAYYTFDNDLEDDQTAGNNDLTGNNTPTYSTDIPFFGVTTRGDEDVFDDESGSTSDLKSSLSELAVDIKSFVPTKEPVKSIALNISAVGTGNWTVVVHDSLNRVQASVTIANATLHAGVYEIVFSEPFRPILNATYHLHVYSSVADGVLVSTSEDNLETAYLKTFYQVLVEDDFHPVRQFLNFMVLGNERYLAIFEAGNIYNPHRVILPSGYRIRDLGYFREYLVMAANKGDTITDVDQGKLFFWDGVSDTFVEQVDIPQGAINSIFGSQGTLYISAGYEGKLLEYRGGDKAEVVKQFPLVSSSDTVELAPSALTMWRSILRVGSAFSTTSTTLHQGVYSWGKLNNRFQDSLGFDYPLSLGDQTTGNTKIGVLYPFGQKLFVGWQHFNNYGIDVVDATGDPFSSATIELLVADLDRVSGKKLPLVFRVDFLPLTDGESISVKYKPDRAGSWLTLATQDTAGATNVRGIIHQRVKEIQFAVDFTDVTITAMGMEIEGEQNARQI